MFRDVRVGVPMSNANALTFVDRIGRTLAALVLVFCLLPVPAFAAATWSSAWTGILDDSTNQITLVANTDYFASDGALSSFLQLNFSAAHLTIPANDTTTIVFARKFTVTAASASIFTQMQSPVNLPPGNSLFVTVVV